MSDRWGRGGATRGTNIRGGGPAGNRRPHGNLHPPPTSSPGGSDKPKREAILDLSKYVDERIRVKFTGGREVTGILKGYDQLLNLVLDDVTEDIQLPNPHTRKLGLVVLRGPTITVLNPVDGFEEIANPFGTQE